MNYYKKKYCSVTCRNKCYYKKYDKRQYQEDERNKEANKPSKDKCKCLICGRYYIQVGSHITQKHNLTAREYREYFRLEVKRGILPEWFRKLKGDQALINGTYKNLKKGKKYWFVPGDTSAGKYERSPITLAKLKVLYKLRKNI
jgi:hypothetical protein